ncbi:AI-2E family transporter [soil metagenome]
MSDPVPPWRPPARLLRAAASSACLLVIGAAVYASFVLLGRLTLVLFPVVVTALLARVLIVPADRLERRGWRPAPRAATVLLGFLAIVVLLLALIVPPMVEEFETLGPTIEDGIERVEDWIVDDSPFDVDRNDLERFKDQAGDFASEALQGSQGQLVSGARLVLEGIAGLILSLILTFFAVKDGPRFQSWATGLVPPARRSDATRMAGAGWASLGGYLRGAAMLGVVEATVIGAAMFLVGSDLVLPVMLLTFAAAFIPIVGATLAGVVAALVTLVTAGFSQALIVTVVVILVQQFDNDLLAPWVYGKALSMHPATILLSITTGTALFGFVGTVLAVPVTAVAVAAWKERRPGDGEDPEPSVEATGTFHEDPGEDDPGEGTPSSLASEQNHPDGPT